MHLPVYWDTYRLILKIFEVAKDFPKDEAGIEVMVGHPSR